MRGFDHLDDTDNLLPQTQWRCNNRSGPRPRLIAQPREGKEIDWEEEQFITSAKEEENFLWGDQRYILSVEAPLGGGGGYERCLSSIDSEFCSSFGLQACGSCCHSPNWRTCACSDLPSLSLSTPYLWRQTEDMLLQESIANRKWYIGL